MIEYVYRSRGNLIDLLLKDDSSGTLAVADLSGTTKMQLKFGGTTVDSSETASAFDWSAGSGQLTLALGDLTLTPGDYKAELIVFNSTYTTGLHWGYFQLVVV